ncbi:response regulator [Lichenicola sp.]|uniref:response regulator n=1 Tax=Lichenicola sp. TaxID=2804529 RepID=UPI003B001092
MTGSIRLQDRRVLVVEDDYLIGDALSEMLQSVGAEVVGPIGWAAEALATVEEADFTVDIALLDVDLHGERSYRIADALMARGVPFVFTTGYHGDVVEAQYRGYPRCEKPLSGRILIETLATMLEKSDVEVV